MWPADWPRAVRDIASATDDAATAARAADLGVFVEASERLRAVDLEQVRAVHSAMVRELLEDLHPDGLTGEAVQAVLERCARTAAVWVPDLQVPLLVAVLTGSLGLSDPDEEFGASDRFGLVRHALLVLADLLGAAQAPASGYLRRAVAEIERAQTVEMP
ncbi:hypothetical protein [Rhodococcus tukisamuensis]|uniref:Uncharacterized protein n=1 Tax=Rhodococcus tukisamuensis TaxID=168276 RepID=A0A1G7DPC8_9NOCA|nr:hypothetical protein [Rhodococcus tukisamuensis]SDE53357.1 hypothetical protein SAMN05444580_12031 [Rhodococcus tukisamuensis]